MNYIYFIKCCDFVKIGYSSNPKKRLSDMQVGSPYQLKMLCAVPYKGDIEDVKIEEKMLHFEYREFRYRGEWFKVFPKMNKWLNMMNKYNRYFPIKYCTKKSYINSDCNPLYNGEWKEVKKNYLSEVGR